MRFTKMHGLGNDFIIVAGESVLPDDASELAIKLCDRQRGVGADGLVFILPSEKDHFKMRVYSASGSPSHQYADAIHCVAKYVFDHRLIDEPEITIETMQAGSQTVQLTIEDAKVSTVRVDMGEPVLQGTDAPPTIDVNGQTFRFTAVAMKDLHGVIYVDDAAGLNVDYWGPLFEAHPYFPNEANVVFATVNSNIHADIRVWEHGSALSWGSGPGACAALVASVLNEKTDRQATVSLNGGSLFVEWDEEDNRVYVIGTSKELYSGKV